MCDFGDIRCVLGHVIHVVEPMDPQGAGPHHGSVRCHLTLSVSPYTLCSLQKYMNIVIPWFWLPLVGRVWNREYWDKVAIIDYGKRLFVSIWQIPWTNQFAEESCWWRQFVENNEDCLFFDKFYKLRLFITLVSWITIICSS